MAIKFCYYCVWAKPRPTFGILNPASIIKCKAWRNTGSFHKTICNFNLLWFRRSYDGRKVPNFYAGFNFQTIQFVIVKWMRLSHALSYHIKITDYPSILEVIFCNNCISKTYEWNTLVVRSSVTLCYRTNKTQFSCILLKFCDRRNVHVVHKSSLSSSFLISRWLCYSVTIFARQSLSLYEKINFLMLIPVFFQIICLETLPFPLHDAILITTTC